MEHRSLRFFFETREAAALALVTVLEDARHTDAFYEFGGLSADQVLASGLHISGQVDDISAKLLQLQGVFSYED